LALEEVFHEFHACKPLELQMVADLSIEMVREMIDQERNITLHMVMENLVVLKLLIHYLIAILVISGVLRESLKETVAASGDEVAMVIAILD
jgi:hypothetical protein